MVVCGAMVTPARLPGWTAALALAAMLAAGAAPAGARQAAAPAAPARTVLVKAARLIDGRGGPPLANAGVLVRGERIERVGPSSGMTADEVIDLGSATILPGLIDLHTHLTDEVGTNWESALLTTTPGRAAIFGAVNARTTLLAGFTTVRDMGPTWPYVDIDLRYAIDKGAVPGPRLQVAGNYVSATGGAGDARQFSIYVDVPIVRNLADGPDEVRKVVRTNLKQGADFTKILATGAVMSKGIPPGAQQYSDAELAAAVEETTRWGKFVASHAHGTEGIKAAVRAGVRTIDHGSMLDEEGARLMKARGTYFAPTLYVGHTILNDNQALNIPAHQVERERAMQGTQEKAFKVALAYGLPIAFATDAGVFPHGENAREFALRVGLGQSPMAAIEGATRIAAEAMGWADRVGTLQAGRFADLIAVQHDPLVDITELERVRFVMKGGTVYKRGAQSADPGARDDR
jgi:imidazolonepropionase-like amidohydrolase